LFGYSVLLCNLLLCLAYVRSYRSMFALRARPRVPGVAAQDAARVAGLQS
jgi:hypothetical protein